MRFAILILSINLVNCGIKAPKITPCNIYSFDVAECVPSDPKLPSYDKKLEDMLGYSCLSARDQGELKKYISNLLDAINKNAY
jgi:hypothetical protein